MKRIESAVIRMDVRGKGRPRFDPRTGHAHTDGATRVAEQVIAWSWRQQAHARPDWRGPVRVWITCHQTLAPSRPKRDVGTDCMALPDLDNVAKLVLDALNGVAWHDDRQVIELKVTKAPWQQTGIRETLAVSVDYGGSDE